MVSLPIRPTSIALRTHLVWHDKVMKRKCKSVGHFIKIIKKEWNAIPLSTIRRCIGATKKRVKWILENDGKAYPQH